MWDRYTRASAGTYDLFRPWLPKIAAAIVVVHLGFSTLNVVQGQSESFFLRFLAIASIVPFIACPILERFGYQTLLKGVLLLSIFCTGPLFLLGGLVNELRSPNPDVIVVIRREFEFLAAFGVFLLASVDIAAALIVGLFLSILAFLLATILFPMHLGVLQPTWITLMSGYIVIYIALVLIARRKSDQAASRSEMSEAIGSSIAHELRTPLLSIKTKASALNESIQQILSKYGEETIPNGRKRMLVARAPLAIAEEAEAATTLIDIFLMNVTGPKSGLETRERFFLDEAIDESVKRFPYRSERERKAIRCKNLLHIEVQGPRLLFVHIGFNLLKNSFEQLGTTSKPVIEISAKLQKDYVILTFTDNGGGIDPKDREKVFEPFYTSTQFGTGVGLAFCRSALEQQFSGTITCESEAGSFTTMTIELPLYKHQANNS